MKSNKQSNTISLMQAEFVILIVSKNNLLLSLDHI